jgi:hypothetical protein
LNLTDLLHEITASDRTDWCKTGELTFHDRFDNCGMGHSKETFLVSESHYAGASYMPNCSITLAWGITFLDNYKAVWANKGPDKRATGHYLDVFYNGALVYRQPYVGVDGGNDPIPLPDGDATLKVSKGAVDLVKVMDRLTIAPRPQHASIEAAIQGCGITIVDRKWPDFS